MKRIVTYSSAALLALAGCFSSVAHAQVPGIINYNGRLTANGNPVNGNGQFKFALVNDGVPGLVTYWSNDGTPDGEPATAVTIQVNNGLFSVALCNTGLANMTPIPASVFANANVHLRIWFRQGNGPYVQLLPDQRVAAVGYAMMSANVSDGAVSAAKLADGSITTAKLADQAVTSLKLATLSIQAAHLADDAVTTPKLANSAVTSAKLADNATTTPKLADGSVTTPKLADAAVTTAKLANNAITGGQIADGTVSTGDLADGAVVTPKLANAAVTTAKLADYSVTPVKIPDDSITGLKMAQNSLTSEDIADTLRLRDLQVESAGGLDRVQLTEANNSGVLYLNHGTIGRFLDAYGTTAGGFLRLYDALGGIGLAQTTAELGSSSVGGYLNLFQDNKSSGVLLQGQNGSTPGGAILLYRETGLGLTLRGSTGAGQGSLLSMYNGLGDVTLTLDGDASGRGSSAAFYNGTGTLSMVIDGDSGSGGLVQVRDNLGRTRVELDGLSSEGAGQLTLYQADGNTGAVIYGADNQGSGAISLRKTNGNAGLRLYGGPGSGSLFAYDTSGTETIQMLAAATSTTGAELRLRNGSGNTTIEMDGDWTPANCGTLRLFKSDGTDTIRLQADFNGEGRIITQVLEITGGSDLSENFDIQSPNAVPGMIVSIDPAHPGELAVSTRAYDRTVAGVVSGAGGVKPGMLMGQHGSKADGKRPVALTGRVYCFVDADAGAIEPGDLITTSATPGHGMKVNDHARAQGAIIGKAMTGLANGKGLVLMLVNLQ
jgi:hypothetical protein